MRDAGQWEAHLRFECYTVPKYGCYHSSSVANVCQDRFQPCADDVSTSHEHWQHEAVLCQAAASASGKSFCWLASTANTAQAPHAYNVANNLCLPTKCHEVYTRLHVVSMEPKQGFPVGSFTDMHQITLQPMALCRSQCANAPIPMLGFTNMH